MFGLGATEILVLMLGAGMALVGGIVALVVVLRTTGKKDEPGNE